MVKHQRGEVGWVGCQRCRQSLHAFIAHFAVPEVQPCQAGAWPVMQAQKCALPIVHRRQHHREREEEERDGASNQIQLILTAAHNTPSHNTLDTHSTSANATAALFPTPVISKISFLIVVFPASAFATATTPLSPIWKKKMMIVLSD